MMMWQNRLLSFSLSFFLSLSRKLNKRIIVGSFMLLVGCCKI